MGFVGLTTAAVMAEKGFTVYGFDKNAKKIKSISESKAPFFEPQLDQLIKNVVHSRKLVPTADLTKSMRESLITFVCVGTPMRNDGSVDLSFVKEVSKEIGRSLKTRKLNYPIICVKSTVPPGTTENIVTKVIEKISGKTAGKDFGIAMTPEFLREGSAVADSRKPHLVVIGSNDRKTRLRVNRFFRSVYGAKVKIMDTNITSAELIKYANNSFLATKISFINTIANICNRIPGANVDVVAKAIGSDPRIGQQFLSAGPGYGGSCFPKDVSGFIQYCRELGYDPVLLRATQTVNKKQIQLVIRLLKSNLGSIEHKLITVLGIAFKKNTDDIRESVSIKLIQELKRLGANIRVHDPMALNNTRMLLGYKEF